MNLRKTTFSLALLLSLSLCLLLTACVSKSGEPLIGPTKGVSIQILKGTASISGETAYEKKERLPIPSFVMNTGDTMSLDVYWGYAMTLTITGIESDVTFTATYGGSTKTYTVSKTTMMGQTLYFNNEK